MSEILAQQIAWGCLAVFCVWVVAWSLRKYRELSATFDYTTMVGPDFEAAPSDSM